MAIFPLAPDQTIAQMWSNGVQGGLLATAKQRICSDDHVTTSGATYTDAVLTAELADIDSAAYSLLAPNSTPSETHRNAVHT